VKSADSLSKNKSQIPRRNVPKENQGTVLLFNIGIYLGFRI
jgi:hypothetical protein